MEMKEKLVDKVIENLKKGFALKDYTVLAELLSHVPDDVLLHRLPEEEWVDFVEDDPTLTPPHWKQVVIQTYNCLEVLENEALKRLDLIIELLNRR
jgi:hypothetical protein